MMLPINERGLPGKAMHAADMDLMASNDSTRESVDILCRADANESGSRVIYVPVASAMYSRLRDTAMRNNGDIIKLNTINANHTINSIAP